MNELIVTGDFINKNYKKLYHFSEHQQLILVDKKYPQKIHTKPHGLWFSDESKKYSWYNWCRNENFNLNGLQYKNKITFKKYATILLITNCVQLDDFTKKFEFEDYNSIYKMFIQDNLNVSVSLYINWEKITKLCDCIFITPYLWKKRSVPWYYTWDCASGCIMNLNAIENNFQLSC